MDGVQEILDLSKVPHFTTLQKFLCRIKTYYFRITFRRTVKLFYSSDENIPIRAIDSSGVTSEYCSHYEQEVITGFVASNRWVQDTCHVEKLLPQCHKTRKSDCFVMDKGYDSEPIHSLIRKELHANSVIPIRSWNNDIVGGIYREEMSLQFNDIVYPRQQIVENKLSVRKKGQRRPQRSKISHSEERNR